MNWHQKTLIALSSIALGAGAADAQTATLTGIIRDSTGSPLPAVEVLLTETTRTARTDDRGRFALANVPPGAYRVWFRRLGYSSTQFDWPASLGQTTEIAVVMSPIPRRLDPVVVMAQEEKELKDRAS